MRNNQKILLGILSLSFALVSGNFKNAYADSDVFEVRSDEPVTLRVLHVTEHPVYGLVPSQIEIEDQATHEKQVVELGTNASMQQDSSASASNETSTSDRKYQVVAAFRAKFPELLGFRIGLRMNDRLEAGIDVGTAFVLTGIGAYLNYHPIDGARGLYLGGRVYHEILVVFDITSATSLEGVLGVRFGPKGEGVYGFAEAGAAYVIAHQSSGSILIPAAALGLGYAF